MARAPAVIVVSSHVVRGAVGNRAAVFALERLGFPVWAVPTVTLAWHPGHGPATRLAAPDDDFAAMLADLEGAPWLGEVGAVLTGYLGHAGQAGPVARLVAAVKRANPEAVYLCDPVTGDRGGLYVPEALAVAIRDRLLPLADIATPNRYELEWLAGRTLATQGAIAEAARSLGPQRMVVTSAPGAAGRLANMLVEPAGVDVVEHAAVERAPNGPGDLFSALFLARLLAGRAPGEALWLATASVYAVLQRAVANGADELMLAADADLLLSPPALPQSDPAAREAQGIPASVRP